MTCVKVGWFYRKRWSSINIDFSLAQVFSLVMFRIEMWHYLFTSNNVWKILKNIRSKKVQNHANTSALRIIVIQTKLIRTILNQAKHVTRTIRTWTKLTWTKPTQSKLTQTKPCLGLKWFRPNWPKKKSIQIKLISIKLTWPDYSDQTDLDQVDLHKTGMNQINPYHADLSITDLNQNDRAKTNLN